MASSLKNVKAFFQWLPGVGYINRLDGVILMETNNPSLEKLYNGHCLVDSPSHCLDNNFIRGLVLKQGEGVGDVVASASLRCDADLVGADGRLLPRLLDPLVPIHGCDLRTALSLEANPLARNPGPRKRWMLVGCGGLERVVVA